MEHAADPHRTGPVSVGACSATGRNIIYMNYALRVSVPQQSVEIAKHLPFVLCDSWLGAHSHAFSISPCPAIRHTLAALTGPPCRMT